MKAFVVDLTHCNGCYSCQIACKDEHVANDWTPYAKPQTDTGQFWLKVNEKLRGSVPKAKMSYMAVMCQHCAEAPCITACTPGAISRRPDGLVVIDPKKCTGCQKCLNAQACPYGVIYYNEGLQIAQKCTGCAHLVDRKVVYAPRCADACPTEALKFGEEADLKDLIAKAEVFHPEYNTKPRVYYIGIPKKFIAGTVYDPGTAEVVIGATLTLSGDGSATAKTDDFGDFWFEGLKEGTYTLKIEAGGKTKTIDKISTAKDINLGDIPLT